MHCYGPTVNEIEKTLTTFSDLGVLPEIAEPLADVGITTPFPIQEMTLSIALLGTDLIGQARTGTGKTLAFGIPVVQRAVAPHDPEYDDLAEPGKPQALVIAPTRELAGQVSNDLTTASKKRGHRVLTVYGGVAYEPQLEALTSGVDIVIGTPGRLLDLANRKVLDLSHVKSLVLDEADEMLDLGFLPDVEKLIAKTPELRQTMLFSATMPSAIVSLARTHMRHPVNIRAESSSDSQTVPATAQFVYRAHDLDKPEVVARILQAEDRGRVIIFTRTKRAAQRVADDLSERGFPTSPLHGDMAQVSREKALKRFREGTVQILVATDVAARGIDVENVSHVINYSCPEDEKVYLHRIGRTGRAGATGVAVTFVDWADLARWKTINAAHDLPFEEPVETYSTSEHFLHDLGIPRDAKGRLKPAPEREPRTSSSAKSRSGAKGGDQPRKRRDRQRSRTRGGKPVEATSQSDGPDEKADKPSGDNGSNPRRRRRRRPSADSTTSGSAESSAS
ncbi:MAG: DEAD/DEAH box helicase [Actinomycetia bacterium]|nr:DEAD/DEAH box helicase [Actinomycetes bacterium]